jgi:hypothetical protein
LFLAVGLIALVVTGFQVWDLVFGTDVVESVVDSSAGQTVGDALRWWDIIYGVGELLIMLLWIGIATAMLFSREDRSTGVGLLFLLGFLIALSNLLGRVFFDRADVPFHPIVDLWRGLSG